jgi:hypothetical protein
MKRIFVLISVLAISIQANADYLIKIQLDPQGINIDLPSEISGAAQLTPSTINRGENATISWSYDYANEVEIEGLGTYGKTGSVNVSSLASRIYKINATYGVFSC